MSRFFVPAVFAATISGLALVLIWGIVARSPETHANVRPEGFDRTPITYLGAVSPFTGVGLSDPDMAAADRPERGQLLFFGFGCATCHGLRGQGGVVGPDLDLGELNPADLRREVRRGPRGMPAFGDEVLSDDDLATIYSFLESIGR